MVANPKIGALYWCVKPFIADENRGDHAPRMPWRGHYYEGTIGPNKVPWLDPVDERGQPLPHSLDGARTYPADLYADRESALRAYALAVAVAAEPKGGE